PVLLGAVATDTEDGNLGATVRWASSRDGALGTGATLVVPSLSVGAHTLTASVTDADGATASASVAVTVVPSQLALLPVADVDAGTATTKLGTATSLLVGTSPVRQAFLRFAVNGIGRFTVQQALLRLTVGSSSSDASALGGAVHAISNHAWPEATTTYRTRPL